MALYRRACRFAVYMADCSRGCACDIRSRICIGKGGYGRQGEFPCADDGQHTLLRYDDIFLYDDIRRVDRYTDVLRRAADYSLCELAAQFRLRACDRTPDSSADSARTALSDT